MGGIHIMKIVKSWKKNLKRTGALALATFVMCGVASFARAEDTITLNGINDTNNTINETGNEKTVNGYQTEAAKGYAMSLTWGNMIFVYDNGTYDPETGRLIATESLDDDKKVQGNAIYIKNENGEDTSALAAGNWYGFDGDNNAVKIENLSTGAVEITATPNNDGAKVDEAKFNLYTFNPGFDLTDDSNDQTFTVNYDFNNHSADADYHGPGSALDCYFASSEVGLKRTFAAATFNDDGSLATSDRDAIYLNISGKPAETLTTETTGEKLGTITLSFKIVDGEGTVGDPLTPVVPVVEQGNQG